MCGKPVADQNAWPITSANLGLRFKYVPVYLRLMELSLYPPWELTRRYPGANFEIALRRFSWKPSEVAALG